MAKALFDHLEVCAAGEQPGRMRVPEIVNPDPPVDASGRGWVETRRSGPTACASRKQAADPVLP